VLFIDSDMRFPQDTIGRMLERDLLVLAANCPRRRMPVGPTAANYDAETQRKVPVYTGEHDTGVEQVDAVGTGVMMVDTNVFRAIEMPWFATPWDVAAKGYMGEDIYFCKLLRDNQIPLYIAHPTLLAPPQSLTNYSLDRERVPISQHPLRLRLMLL